LNGDGYGSVSVRGHKMTGANDIADTITAGFGVDRAAARTVARYLGEARMIPRGTRGRPAASMLPVDAAKILLGVLAAADAFAGSAKNAAALVPQIESLSRGGVSAYSRRNDETGEDEVTVAPACGFLGELAFAIEHGDAVVNMWDRIDMRAAAYGITFGGEALCGWIRYVPVDMPEDAGPVPTYERRYGDHRRVFAAGFLRSYEIPPRLLAMLRDLFAEVPELPLAENEGAAEAAPMILDPAARQRGSASLQPSDEHKDEDTFPQAESGSGFTRKRNPFARTAPDEQYRPPNSALVACA
jgi:hypothetical protein